MNREEFERLKDEYYALHGWDVESGLQTETKLKELLNKATKMVVLVGETTHNSQWVNWEIQVFYDKKSNLPGDAAKRIKAMYVKECRDAKLPSIARRLEISTIAWDLTVLNRWFKINLNQ